MVSNVRVSYGLVRVSRVVTVSRVNIMVSFRVSCTA